MIEKIVNIRVNSNVSETTKDVEKLTSTLKGTATQAQELGTSTSGLEKLKGIIGNVGEAASGLNPAFGAASKGMNGLITKCWEFVANPIGLIIAAIVVGLKFLYEAFQSSVSGGKEIKAVFAGIMAVGDQVKDAIFGLARSLMDVVAAAYKFITLDFKGAAESMKDANKEAAESYKQLGAAMTTTAKKFYDLEKAQQANDKARKIAAVEDAKAHKLLVKSRELLTDEEASLQDKRKALTEVTKVETEASNERIRIAKEDLRIAAQGAADLGGEKAKKKKQEIRELQAAFYDAQAEGDINMFKLNKQRRQLDKQETAGEKEEADKRSAQAKEAHDKDLLELQNKLKEEGRTYDQRRKLVLNDTFLTEKERRKLINEINNEELKAKKEHLQSLKDLENKYFADLLTMNAKTEQEKLDLQAQRDLQEINKIAKTAKEKETLMAYYNEKYIQLDAELQEKLKKQQDDADKKAAEEAKKKADKELANRKLVAESKVQIELEAVNAIGGLTGLLSSFDSKNKALQRAALIAQSAVGIAAIIINTNKANMEALANPVNELSGGTYAAARIPLNWVTAGISIASTIGATVKGLSALGGGGAPSGGGGAATSAPPKFNIVGQNSNNQLAQTIAQRQGQPVQAYVVSGNISNAQSLDRNRISTATFN